MLETTLVSVEAYLHTAYRPDREYVEGVVVERNVGTREHSRLQSFFIVFLGNLEAKLDIQVFPEQRVQVRSDRFRVPDILVVVGRKPTEPILTQPPFLCVEILSPDDRMSEMQDRIEDYLAFGVRYVWVVDPRLRRAYEYTAEGGRRAAEATLRTSDPELEVPLGDFFNRL